MTYDAAELQDMRDRRDFLSANDVLAIIDALEKAQEDVDLWRGTANAVECVLVNTRAERDSARALLTEIRADAERGAAELDGIAEINKLLGDRG